MSLRSLMSRWHQGVNWSWRNPRFRDALPVDFETRVMAIESSDRFHAKQGRSTARVRFDTESSSVSGYLKRHYRVSLRERVAAYFDPAGRHSPAAVEWVHLDRARSLGIAVPETLAVGEWIGPRGKLESYLLVAELVGQEPLNEALPKLESALDPAAFASLKRGLCEQTAEIAAQLHTHAYFHKDLYLCHFFVDLERSRLFDRRITLIDLHRLERHPWSSWRWRSKDLGQLLFSTFAVSQIDNRDRVRFWKHYRRIAGLGGGRGKWHAQLAVWRASRYRSHNTNPKTE